jgi:hypothetical protein
MLLLNIPAKNGLGFVCYPCKDFLEYEHSINTLYNSTCTMCTNTVPVDMFRTLPDNTFICVECYTQIYWYCRRCDSEHNFSDLQPVILPTDYNQDMSFCPECAEIYQRESFVHTYDYIPKPKFYKEDNEYMNLLYFGIELEMECYGNDKYKLADRFPEFVYIKNDGSLDNGFEIVSHPMSYRWLMNHKSDWQTMLDLRKEGWRSFNTETCGMHIHLSKIAFGNHHLYKFMKLFYGNPDFILKISQRDSKSRLKRWSSVNLTEKAVRCRAKEKQTYNHDDRYTAVNLNRLETVEVRVFRGTLLAESFWKNIEFVKAAYEFSYKYNSNYMTEISFRKYLRINKKEFKNLYNFLYDDNSLKVYNEGEVCV